MNKTISVIIPVYNVEAYLPECMDSILSQSYQDLEIILIDDGSTDNSGQLCDDYAAKDARIRVIHQKNSGAGAAKNAGLRVATGYYLTFLDSDDYLEPGAYEYMVKKMENSGVDIVQCGYRDVYVNRQEDNFVLKEEQLFFVQEYLRRYTVDWTCGLLWDKLYKRELYAGVYFEEGHIVDDEFFTYQGVINAKTVLYSPHIVCNYRKRQSSVTLRLEYQMRTISDRLDYLVQRRERVSKAFPQLKEPFDRHYIAMLQWLCFERGITEELLVRIKSMIRAFLKEKKTYRFSLKEWWAIKKILRTSYEVAYEKSCAVKSTVEVSECFK